ncbi:hypothetical protein, partial [Candidatus Viridilinea mediisalina]
MVAKLLATAEQLAQVASTSWLRQAQPADRLASTSSALAPPLAEPVEATRRGEGGASTPLWLRQAQPADRLASTSWLRQAQPADRLASTSSALAPP